MGNEGRIWAVSVTPESMDTVTIEIEAGLDCDLAGAVCAADGRRLFNRMELTVAGVALTVDEPTPEPENNPATGAPSIRGEARVGETLRVSLAALDDADGLSGATFTYQWLADDADIQNATDSTYILDAEDEGKTVKVRVSFTDDAGNEETMTSATTTAVAARPNNPATGVSTISGTAQVGETLTAETSGIADVDGLSNVRYSYQWSRDSGSTETDISGATSPTYTLQDDDIGYQLSVTVSFTGDEGFQESLTSESVYVQPPSPLYGGFDPDTVPTSHDGTNAFTFQIHFSEEPALGFAAVRDHVLAVANGDVTQVKRTTPCENIRREITVQPDGDDAVTVVLPATTDCAGPGAVCTSSGKMLSNTTSRVIPGPGSQSQQETAENTAATGVPAITGGASIGNTVTADVSGISDANGLTGVSYSYQWTRSDTSISGATSSTYTVVKADGGHNLKVTVSFTDDEGFDESVTSAAVGIARPPLTAELVRTTGTPDNHDGSTAFTIRLNFSEHFGIGYTTVRDHALDVAGGSVTEVSRVAPSSEERNRQWEITIKPSGNDDIQIALTPTTDCSAEDAICTPDGRMLSSNLTMTIAGPP